MAILIAAIKIIFLLGFLILIHECGHFIAARLCRVKVNEFAIGMGPKILKKEKKGTKYTIRLFPIGGFVNMEGEERRSDKEGSYSEASIPKRMAIIISGAVVNIIFAILIYFILISIVPKNKLSLTVDAPIAETGAESIGILPGDKIQKVNDKKIRIKSDIDKVLENCNGENIDVTIKRGNEILDFNFTPHMEEYKSIGVYFDGEGDNRTAQILAVVQGSPAEKIGLREKDKMLKVNGIDTEDDGYKVSKIINETNTDKVEIEIQRKDETKIIEVEVEKFEIYYIGVVLQPAEEGVLNNIYYAIWNTRDFVFEIANGLKMLFTGSVGVDQLTGPIGISSAVTKTNGVYEFIYLLAIISLSLGVTNLLPFPPLDGGKVVILAIEGIRKKPLKENIEVGIQMVGFALIILLAIYVSYKDILRIF